MHFVARNIGAKAADKMKVTLTTGLVTLFVQKCFEATFMRL